MQNITGTLMSEDRVIAYIKNGAITDADDTLLPLYLNEPKMLEKWLAYRAVDHSRKRTTAQKSLGGCARPMMCRQRFAVNAATVTDRYWFRPEGSVAVYEDIRFKENYFSELALRGDPDSFSNRPSRTPELPTPAALKSVGNL